MSLSTLIITNNRPLGAALMFSARVALGDQDWVSAMTYQEAIAFLPQRRRETDFLILELFREYPGGIRAEGITLARREIPGKPCLIVSPFHVSAEIGCPGYWDVSANDTLPERIRSVLANPYQCLQAFDELEKRFSKYLELPPQH